MTDEVFDLDALERDGDPPELFRFRFGGETFELPGAVDFRVVAALDAGHLREAMVILLGTAQYERMIELPALFDRQAFDALMKRYAKHTGSSLGELLASTDSSGSTEGPSKQTSNGSTKSSSPTSSLSAAGAA